MGNTCRLGFLLKRLRNVHNNSYKVFTEALSTNSKGIISELIFYLVPIDNIRRLQPNFPIL